MTALRAALNWWPRTPFFYGWLVLGVGALGAFAATSIAGVVLGGIQGLIVTETGWNRSTIGLAAACGVWGSGLSAPLIGRLADRYGPRWLMPLGTLLMGVALFALAGAYSIWLFFLVAVLARAVSQPVLIGVVPRTVAVNFFRRKRNTALAWIGMFRPLSGAILIQLIAAIAIVYDWRVAFRCIGVLSLFFTLPMLLIIRRRPEDIGLLPDGTTGQIKKTPTPCRLTPARGKAVIRPRLRLTPLHLIITRRGRRERRCAPEPSGSSRSRRSSVRRVARPLVLIWCPICMSKLISLPRRPPEC